MHSFPLLFLTKPDCVSKLIYVLYHLILFIDMQYMFQSHFIELTGEELLVYDSKKTLKVVASELQLTKLVSSNLLEKVLILLTELFPKVMREL